MSFEWLNKFHQSLRKDANYVEKTLTAYGMGIRAKGAITGVVIERGSDCCEAAGRLEPGRVYSPSEAPRLPLPGCTLGANCRCVYRPLMVYQHPSSANPEDDSGNTLA